MALRISDDRCHKSAILWIKFWTDSQQAVENKRNLQAEEVAQRLKAIIDTAIDCIIIIDEKGTVETINDAGVLLFQYAESEVVGKNVSMLMPEPDHSRHDQYLSNYLETGKAKIIGIGREVTGKKKDGTTFPLRLAVSEVKLDRGRMFTGIIHDLTEMKAAEREIKKLNEDLESKVVERTEELGKVVNRLLSVNKQLEKEITERRLIESKLNESKEELKKSLDKERELGALKSRFVSMASHEFRTPLSTILSSAALISRYNEGDQQDNRNKHIQRIKSSVENLNGILNDFLSLSKLEEGRVKPNLEAINMGEFLQGVLEEINASLKPGQWIDVENSLPHDIIISDRHILRNLILNLISNAVKYSDEGQRIVLRCSTDDQTLIIEVEDFGIGIPEDDQQYLFSRFFRASNVINIKGTGLGLTIVKTYLDLIDGSISFESTEGKGSRFIIFLPQNY